MAAYERWSYQALKKLAEDRDLNIPGDQRTKKSLIEALKVADMQDAEADEAAEAAEAAEQEPKSKLEQDLESKVPGPRQRMSFGRDYTVSQNVVNEQLKVGNLPSDYVHAWASLTPASGEDIGRWTNLGWIRVTSDMVTSNPNDPDRIYVKNYEDYGGYVKHKDTLLVIANRRLVEEREAGYRERWNSKVEKMYGKRGELTKDRVGDPAESSGRSYRRTAQWKAEEMLKGGG